MIGARPGVAAHVLPADGLPQLDVPIDPGGLVLGREGQSPVVVQLFRGRPTYVGLFAGAYVARVIAFRALAVAAQVAVMTPRPAVWQPLVRSAPAGWVVPAPPGAPTPPAGTPIGPSLVLDDAGMGEAQLRGDLGAWQAQVIIRPFATPHSIGQLRSFDAVALQRVQPEAVQPLQFTFGLPDQTAQWLPQMPDDTVAVLAGGQVRFVNLSPTQAELSAFGQPTRLDG
jgi:ESX secretion system protein EccE